MSIVRGESDTPQGVLTYRLCEPSEVSGPQTDSAGAPSGERAGAEIEITGYRGRDMRLAVPAEIDGYAVTRIGRKAFLSNKTLREIRLPDTVAHIDDWAFAYCTNLQKLTLPYRRIGIGQGVFKECARLEQIADGSRTAEAGETSATGAAEDRAVVDTAYLLAAVGSLDAFYLLDPADAGSPAWLARWDDRMGAVMRRSDAEGFSKMLLCGEEDYGSRDNNLDYYMTKRRKEKVRLAMLRLMHDYGLADAVRSGLTAYLLEHIKGASTEETWQVILEEHGDELAYYEFLTGIGGVTAENFQPMMDDMGQSHTEMKAYLMKYHGERQAGGDAFAAFEL